MALPYLQSYTDLKLQKAYEIYVGGASQGKAAKVSRVSRRTLERRCAEDGWAAEKRTRKMAEGTKRVPPIGAGAAETSPAAAQVTENATQASSPHESRSVGMEAMLREWQGIVAVLRGEMAVEVAAEREKAIAAGKRMPRQQIAQLSALAGNLAALDKKVWCVPDKIETKDTTPTAEDRVRSLKDDDLERQLTAVERGAAAAAEREAAPQSVN